MQRYEPEGKKKDPSCQILIVLIMKGIYHWEEQFLAPNLKATEAKEIPLSLYSVSKHF